MSNRLKVDADVLSAFSACSSSASSAFVVANDIDDHPPDTCETLVELLFEISRSSCITRIACSPNSTAAWLYFFSTNPRRCRDRKKIEFVS